MQPDRADYFREYYKRPEVQEKRKSEAHKAYMRAYREKNKERIAANWRKWYEANREYAIRRGVASEQIRRARKMAAERIEAINRDKVYERDAGRCHICRRKVSRRAFHIDHLIPLSKGGNHTYDNVAVAHPKCNLRRNDGKVPAQLLLVGTE